jgi:DNA-binding NtrC family response regulator
MAEPVADILVVEDEDIARRNLEHILKKETYKVTAAKSGQRAIELLTRRDFDLVLTDLKMDGMDGMQVLRKSRELQPNTEVVVITGYATVDSAVAAMKEGAYYYIAKPYNIAEIRQIVRQALTKRRLKLENLELRNTLKKSEPIPYIVGKSSAITELVKTIRQIAPADSNVLILGESGTGKELAAKAIHHLSARAENRFVAFNCGAFSDELMANELFGHEKGAFTGAVKEKIGLLQAADKGTVFLDEIGDMPMSMQVKLLRVIQEKELLRVGSVDPVQVDVRFIAATHRDLQEDVQNGQFRQDLYYRLNVIALRVPSLSERPDDIPLLVNHFLNLKSAQMGKAVEGIEQEALNLLSRYSWPGNVRELENVLERALALETGPLILAADMPEYIQNLSIETYRHRPSEIPSLEEQEISYIRWVLEKCSGNKTQAARIMGIDRVSLWRKLKKYGIE